MAGPTPRWTQLRAHHEQSRLRRSRARFKVLAAGRRSGKTEHAKRDGVEHGVGSTLADGWTIFGAPTFDQAKRIWWEDLKAMVPRRFMRKAPNESSLTIRLLTGYELQVLGMDRPERIEGRPVDRGYFDEVDNMKAEALEENILPAMATPGRPGSGWFFGVPEGRGLLWDLRKRGLDPSKRDWEYFHWTSDTVLTDEELRPFRETMDPRAFEREFCATFHNFESRAYYPFDWNVHAIERLAYDPSLPLIFCFDFNVAPGVAVVCQEQAYRGMRRDVAPTFTAVIGEVWIDQDSNTEKVCAKLIEDWKGHSGPIYLYGDATGGAKGTARVQGSDWDLIVGRDGALRRYFGDRVRSRVRGSNPRQKVRINSMNRRLLTADGLAHMLVDATKAPHVCEDLDGVTLLAGSDGEIDKATCERADLTHVSDGLGYYISEKFPVAGSATIHRI